MNRITNADATGVVFDSNSCSSNLAIHYGGCVYYYEDINTKAAKLTLNAATGTLTNSVWSSNKAKLEGAVFYIHALQSITLSVTSNDFNTNLAETNGAGFYLNSDGIISATFITSKMTSNTATTSGGFLYVNSNTNCQSSAVF